MQPVSAIITGFIRLTAYMNLDAMNPMLKKGDVEISAKPDHGGGDRRSRRAPKVPSPQRKLA